MARSALSLTETLRLQLLAYGLPEPCWEYKFHPARKFRFDLAFPPPFKVAAEIHGGIYLKGRTGHTSVTGVKRDYEKANLAQILGWVCLALEPDTIRKTSQAADWIYQAMLMRGWRASS